MKNKYKFLFFSLLILLILFAILIQSLVTAKAKSDTQKAVELVAPDFILKDLNGHKFKLSDYRGKPILLIFGTTWCSYCRAEIPHFKNIYTTYGNKGLEVINIDINEPQEKVSRFAAYYHLPYSILLDEDGVVSENYNVRGVPTMVLINGEGKIICLNCRSIDSILEKLFEKKDKSGKK